jgi:hypothetical protein
VILCLRERREEAWGEVPPLPLIVPRKGVVAIRRKKSNKRLDREKSLMQDNTI